MPDPTYPSRHRIASYLLCALILLGALGCRGNARRGGSAITVASAHTPEQLVLGQITVQALRAAGYTVVDQTGMGDQRAVRTAVETGRADLYWDYTGDTWTHHLGHDIPISDPQEMHRQVREQDARNEITWLSPTRCRHVMGLVLRREMARQNELTDIEDLLRYISRYNPYMSLCTPEDVYDQFSGVRGLARIYGLHFDQARMRYLSIGDGYEALADGVCDVAIGYSTDPPLVALDLVMLNDARGLFQSSPLAVAVRTPLLREYPALEGLLAQVSTLLTQETVLELGQQVGIHGEDPEVVARRFLTENNLAGKRRLFGR